MGEAVLSAFVLCVSEGSGHASQIRAFHILRTGVECEIMTDNREIRMRTEE